MITGDSFGPAAYLWPYLLRYGLTDDVELRLLGNGVTSVFGSDPTSGFSPTVIDMKVHLWDGNERFIPASSLEGLSAHAVGKPGVSGRLATFAQHELRSADQTRRRTSNGPSAIAACSTRWT